MYYWFNFNNNTILVPSGASSTTIPVVDIVSCFTPLQKWFIIVLFPTFEWPTIISLNFLFVVSGFTFLNL